MFENFSFFNGFFLWIIIATISALALGAVLVQVGYEQAFLSSVRAALKNENFGESDLQRIASRWFQRSEKVSFLLNVLLVEFLERKDAQVELRLIRQLVAAHEEVRPYAQLPDSVRAKLIELEPKVTGGKPVLQDLVGVLSEIYEKNRREIKFQKIVAIVGIIIGLVGVLAAWVPLTSP